MRYYIIAGEASGDLHAANLMKQIKLQDSHAEFRCWGGDLMQQQGAELVKHYRDLAFMGFIEVLLNIKTILNNLKICKEDILQYKPDALILVDYPGFNMRIAEFAKQKGFKVIYYISPQIWAWKQNRVHKIKRTVDKMIVILPFESDFYEKFDYKVEYVGHPLLDAIEDFAKEKLYFDDFVKKYNLLDKPIVALLPGSRKQEINKMLKVMLSISSTYPDYQFVIAGAPSIESSYYESFIKGSNVKVVHNATYKLLQQSSAALVTSGTATLETALFGVPEVVCYSGSKISYHIAKRLIKVKYISLVNLIMDKPVVTELIQDDFNPFNLKMELNKLLYDSETKQRLFSKYTELKKKLGNAGASEKAAKIVVDYLNE
jgi:lipid-A-disaccharide synthase